MAEEDILFGKKRHLFGGIEPSNMKKFEVDYSAEKVIIDAQLPDNTVVNGQTLCTVAGAVIRRKTDGYPVDEFDGDEIANIFEDTMVVDESGYTEGDNTEYYYAAFPYTTQGVYNRNEANRASFNVPVFEIVSCECSDNNYENGSNPSIRIYVKVPSSVGTVKVCRSTTKYDDAMQHGTLFGTGNDGLYYYVDLEVEYGKTYYYTFGLPTSKYPLARVSVYAKPYNYLYGFDLDTSDENPETRVSYPDDVMNAHYEPVFMDYLRSKFNYGDWDLKPGEAFMPKPCMISYEGEVAHYLDPNNYLMQEDGVTPSRADDTTFPGNAMMEWPAIYTKRWEENGIYHFRCSDRKLGPDWKCWCNTDYGNEYGIQDHFYTAIYASAYYDRSGFSTGQSLRSISGTTIKTGLNSTEYRDYARYKKNGTVTYDSGWDVSLLSDHLLLQDLLILISKSTNTQKVFGNGLVNGSSISKNGTMDDKGLFWGCDDNTHGVKIFGMENMWGSNKRYIAGWTSLSGKHYLKITKNNADGVGYVDDSIEKKWSRFGVDYLSNNILVSDSPISGSSDSYISGMITLPYGRMPIAANGSATTYECDTISWTTGSTKQVYYAGGYKMINGGVTPYSTGAFYAYNASSTSGMSDGCAYLSFKPTK